MSALDAAQLRGIIPPLITPLSGRDSLDTPGLERLIEHVLAGGVSGLFILGTTGEGPSLSYRLRSEMVIRTCRQVRGRVPVLVGISDTAFVESVNMARIAAEAGAAAVVVAPPFYLPGGQPELREYIDHLVPELPLPLFLYNMPALTKVPIGTDTLRHALQLPGIVGFKDSSGDLDYFRSVTALIRSVRPEWPVLIGPEEHLLDALRGGGDGGVSGGANLFPQLYVQLCAAHESGDVERAQSLQDLIRRVGNSIYRVGAHSSSIIKGIKCALSCLGVCDDFMGEPFHRFHPPQRQLIESRLADLRNDPGGANTILNFNLLTSTSP